MQGARAAGYSETRVAEEKGTEGEKMMTGKLRIALYCVILGLGAVIASGGVRRQAKLAVAMLGCALVVAGGSLSLERREP